MGRTRVRLRERRGWNEHHKTDQQRQVREPNPSGDRILLLDTVRDRVAGAEVNARITDREMNDREDVLRKYFLRCERFPCVSRSSLALSCDGDRFRVE